MPLLFAKASEGEFLLGLFFILIVVIIALISAALRGSANYDVRIKGGAPYCPRCNRQVSYRRTNCRCCGYIFVSYGEPKENLNTVSGHIAKADRERREAIQESEERARRNKQIEEARKKEDERLAAIEAKRASYLQRGITPGPLAWFESLNLDIVNWYKGSSDLMQACIWAVCLSIPAAVLAAFLFRH
jgi:hypothetical protein